MQLVTKTGIVLSGKYGNKTIYYNSSKEEILREMDNSLRNFGTDHVDLLLVHRRIRWRIRLRPPMLWTLL